MSVPTVQIKGFVYVRPAEAWEPPGDVVHVLPREQADAAIWGVCVGAIDMPTTIPATVDIKAEAARRQLAVLNRRRDAAREEFAKKMVEIDAHVAKLLPATAGAAE